MYSVRVPFLVFSIPLLLSAGDGIVGTLALNYTSTRQVTTHELLRIQRLLEKLNKPAVRSIQSSDVDIIDCIPQHKQPAFDHPLLKNHKIQTLPPQVPRFKGELGVRNYPMNDTERRAWQAWNHVGHCPMGTVPIRRSSVNDVLRAKSLLHYGKKQLKAPHARKFDAPDTVSGNNHEYAIAYTWTAQEIYGAKAAINVWDPSIQLTNEFSLAQIWIIAGSFDGPDLNTIEAGWQVSPELYGDSKPRLFIYWTRDSYKATGCYNLLCPGFVQTSSEIAVGAAISPVSTYAGPQYDITILIWKDPNTGNWWLALGDQTVGYWPKELFTHLADHAIVVEWGGEVVNRQPHGKHTSTQMGSGHFAREGFGKASFFRNLGIVDSDNSLILPQSVSTKQDKDNCYDIRIFSGSADWGTYFYYGGPGNNPKCPLTASFLAFILSFREPE